MDNLLVPSFRIKQSLNDESAGCLETSVTTSQRCVTSQQNEGIVNQLPSDVISATPLRKPRKWEKWTIGIVSESVTKISKRKIQEYNQTASSTS